MARRPARLLILAWLCITTLACGTSDPTLLVCSGGGTGSTGPVPGKLAGWSLATCRGSLNLAARTPPRARAGTTVEVAVRAVNEAPVDVTIRYTVAVQDADGTRVLSRSPERVVTVPAGGEDERLLTLAIPADFPPGSYLLQIATGLRRPIGPAGEPYQIREPIDITRP